ncbi:MAG TPA: hypothetical protein VIL30_07160 [Ramlibacter sp.]|jgi:hypothetical protein
MIVLSWILFAFLALLWTGAAWITAAMLRWLGDALASGTAPQAARDIASLPLPDWGKFWIDPAWFEMLQSMTQWAIGGAGAGLPIAGTAMEWLVPALWIGWGFGMALLLAGAVAVHLVLRRFRRRHGQVAA